VPDNRGNPSKRFWGRFLVFWIVLGLASLALQAWWTVATAAGGVWLSAVQRRKAADKPA
jgi:hypothetical protein